MFPAVRSRLLAGIATLLVFVSSGSASSANWVTIKNDTGKPMVVQETVVVNGQVKRGKAVNLLAGESLREFIPGPTVKKVEMFDAANPNQAVWSGELNCPANSQTFSVAVSGGKVTVTAASVPKK